MKRRIVIAILALTLIAALVGGTAVMAAKPQQSGSGADVIADSNGFPSGPHFNLNIHGKDPATFTCPDEDPYFEGWGNSVFVDINGTTDIYYMTCKKSNIDSLTVLDGCGVFDGSVEIQLPKIPDGLPLEDQGYHVFARILGKPNNGKNDPSDTRSYIFLSPNEVSQICNDPQGSDEDGWYCDSELSLGLILKNGDVYGDGGEEFYRFDDPQGKGKGNSKAVDITRLFTFTGWVIDARLDNYSTATGEGWGYSDGAITVGDIPVYDWDCDGGAVTADNRDVNGDTSENPDLAATEDDDLDMYLSYMAGQIPGESCWLYCLGYELDPQVTPMAWEFTDAWILNIAEFVLTEGEIINDGTKLLQIRFYPRWTTEYIEPTS
jgi:hypothetical protein